MWAVCLCQGSVVDVRERCASSMGLGWGSEQLEAQSSLVFSSFWARNPSICREIDEESMKSHEKSCYQHILLVERSLSLRRAARALLRCELLKAMHSPCLVCI